MATYAPAWSRVSLLERLIGAQFVLVGRSRGLVNEWKDTCGQTTQYFGVAEVEVLEMLYGEVPKLVRVRLADTGDEDGRPMRTRLAAGNELLLLLCEDEPSDVPQFGLQYGSAFPVRDRLLELPDDLPLGEYAAVSDFSLDIVRLMLDSIEAEAKQRRIGYEEVDGPDWSTRPYPEVEEIGAPNQDRLREIGPKDMYSPNSGLIEPRT